MTAMLHQIMADPIGPTWFDVDFTILGIEFTLLWQKVYLFVVVLSIVGTIGNRICAAVRVVAARLRVAESGVEPHHNGQSRQRRSA